MEPNENTREKGGSRAMPARDAVVAALARIPDVALPEDDDDLVAVVFDLAADTALDALRSLPVAQRMEAMGMAEADLSYDITGSVDVRLLRTGEYRAMGMHDTVWVEADRG